MCPIFKANICTPPEIYKSLPFVAAGQCSSLGAAGTRSAHARGPRTRSASFIHSRPIHSPRELAHYRPCVLIFFKPWLYLPLGCGERARSGPLRSGLTSGATDRRTQSDRWNDSPKFGPRWSAPYLFRVFRQSPTNLHTCIHSLDTAHAPPRTPPAPERMYAVWDPHTTRPDLTPNRTKTRPRPGHQRHDPTRPRPGRWAMAILRPRAAKLFADGAAKRLKTPCRCANAQRNSHG